MRKNAKEDILKIQNENRNRYNLRRKRAKQYQIGDLVAIKRTQFGPNLKLKQKFLGPYEISKVKSNNTYDVTKASNNEGPRTTTTCAEFMKPWSMREDDAEFETNSTQDGRNVGSTFFLQPGNPLVL